jgi:parallel beta-helix repeat protein
MSHCFKLPKRLARFLPDRIGLAIISPLTAGALLLVLSGCSESDSVTNPSTDAAPVPVAGSAADSAVIAYTDTTGDHVDPRMAAASTGTIIYPGQDIQAKVASAPGGTTFTLKAGIYRLQAIAPKTGDVFVGETGAILSGARLISSFTKSGAYWVAGGQTQQNPIKSISKSYCLPDSPGCYYPEQLFINDVLQKHVTSLAAVTAGTWYLDYAADKLYISVDPTGKKVEASVTSYAFRSSASSVTISGLIVEKYATPPGDGTIDGGAGSAWVVKNNEVRWNQGKGIRTGGGMQVLNNKVHHQGQLGIAGGGNNLLVQGNEISYNNTAGFTTGWEAGGSKFVGTNGLVFRGNFSHHNHGAGIHCDIDCINTLIDSNTVNDNDWRGIFYEISYKATIRNNTALRNGFKIPKAPGLVDGAGVQVSCSRDVEVYGNTVAGNRTGIGAYQTNRGSGAYGAHLLYNLYVHDNSVTQTDGGIAAGVTQSVGSNAVFTSQNNRFVHDTYDLGTSTKYFEWMNARRTTVEWKGYKLDTTGTFK